MKFGDVETKCPCGAKLKMHLKKPTATTRQIHKVDCSVCQSKFLAVTFKENGEYGIDFDLLILSPLAQSKLKAGLDDGPKENSRGDEPGRADEPVEVPDGGEVAGELSQNRLIIS